MTEAKRVSVSEEPVIWMIFLFMGLFSNPQNEGNTCKEGENHGGTTKALKGMVRLRGCVLFDWGHLGAVVWLFPA